MDLCEILFVNLIYSWGKTRDLILMDLMKTKDGQDHSIIGTLESI